MEKREKLLLALVGDAIQAGGMAEETAGEIRGLELEELDGLLELAKMHNLAPMIGQFLYTERPDWPRAAALRQSVLTAGMETARKSVALTALTQELFKAGIPYAVVKGAVCRTLYPNGDLRISTDEDILVKDQKTAEQILEAMGYVRLTPAAREGDRVHTWMGDSGLVVELHRALLEEDGISGVEENALGKELLGKYCVKTAYGSLWTLPPQSHLLYLIFHFYVHFLAGGIGLRQVCDIVLFAQRYGMEIQWEPFWQALSKARLDVLFCNLVDIGRRYLRMPAECVPVPDGMDADSGDLLADILSAGVFGKSTLERKQSSRITLEAVNRGRDGRHTWLRAAFPRKESLVGEFPYLEKQPWLLPAAWAGRIARYLRQGGGKRAAASVEIGNARVELLKKYGIIGRDTDRK